eukprot:CAMPEP_0113662346 /NCGR_PEP_ID=MMETSP0038_2-20120614/518_1 /TAXON_ID=2898 /ORGANISM="Cryptomonas paramecium" /LENGTH=152 /DNA_ID=CAMNT_0000577217 /DNA_START=71 /DNA_END=529 /DNA_ORIENTATION=+ /assembly_acc=CAM_ASM_000170
MNEAVKLIDEESGADKMMNFKEWTSAWEKLQAKFPEVQNIKDSFRNEIWYKCPVSVEHLIKAVKTNIGGKISDQTLGLMEDACKEGAGKDGRIDYSEWYSIWEDIQDKDAFFAAKDDELMNVIWYDVAITRQELVASIQDNWDKSARFKVIG